jgi:hypothetical protein
MVAKIRVVIVINFKFPQILFFQYSLKYVDNGLKNNKNKDFIFLILKVKLRLV